MELFKCILMLFKRFLCLFVCLLHKGLSSLVNKIDFSELKNRMVINSDCDITIEGYLRDTDLVQPTSVLKSRRSHGLANGMLCVKMCVKTLFYFS